MTPTASSEFNPILPTNYDVLWGLAAALGAALFIVALVVWFADRSDTPRRVLDLAALVMIPVVGPAAFLAARLWRSRAARTSRTVATPQ